MQELYVNENQIVNVLRGFGTILSNGMPKILNPITQ